MPTHDELTSFLNDWKKLSPQERAAFKEALTAFVEDLRKGGKFRASLRVKQVRKRKGTFEMTWAGDGRATFSFGDEVKPGEPHVVWRRIGTHDIFDRP